MSSHYATEYTTQYTQKEMKYKENNILHNINRNDFSLQYPFVDNKSTVADILGAPDHHLYGQRFSCMGLAARKRSAQNVFKGI